MMKTRLPLLATGLAAVSLYFVSRPHSIDSTELVPIAYTGFSAPTIYTVNPASTALEPAPTQVIPYGAEFWRPKPLAEHTNRQTKGTPLPAAVSIPEVMDRVAHAIGRKQPGTVRSTSYCAEFTDEGMRFHSGESAMLFATRGFRQGDRFVPAEPTPWQFTGNTAQREIAPGLIEHMETRREGTSVTWVLQKAPSTSEDAVIEAGIEGLSFAATSDKGSHFADANGVSRVRIGTVTAVDSGGQKTSLQTRQIDSGLEITIPKTLLASAIYPLAIDPLISSEAGINTPVTGAVFAGVDDPTVAFNNNRWLLVYEISDGVDSDVVATRIDPGGVVLDNGGIVIENSDIDADGPTVTANGAGWFVAFELDNAGLATSNLSGRLVNFDGSTGSILPISLPGVGVTDSVFDADSCTTTAGIIVVTCEVTGPGRNGVDVVAFRLDSTGTVVTSNRSVCNAAGDQLDPRITASASGTALIIWEDTRNLSTTLEDIFIAPLSAAGTITPTNGILLAGSATAEVDPDISFLNSATINDSLAVWRDGDTVRASRIPFGGAPVASFVVDAADVGNDDPNVIGDGLKWIVVYTDDDNANDQEKVLLRTVAANQAVGATEFTLLNATSINSDIALSIGAPSATGTIRLVIMTVEDLNNVVDEETLFALFVASDEAMGSPFIASRSTQSSQGEPAIASNGSDWLVVWSDTSNPGPFDAGSDIIGTRISSSLVIKDPAGLDINISPGNQLKPVVDSVGGTWLVAWEDLRDIFFKGSDIRCARVTSAGAVLDPNGIVIATQATDDKRPTVAGNGVRWMVAWEDRRTPANVVDIRRTIVETNGTLSNADQVVANSIFADQDPAIASLGGNWLIVFETGDQIVSPTGLDIGAVRVGADGTSTLSLTPGGDAGDVFNPAVASNGIDWLVVWDEPATFLTVGRRVNAAGTVLTPLIVIADISGQPAQITGVGNEWQVLTTDSNFDIRTSDFLKLSRISAAGTVLASEMPVSTVNRNKQGTLAFNPASGTTLVVSQVRRGDNARIEAQRVDFRQFISFNPPAKIEFKRSAITLSASTNARLPVSLRILSGPARLSGNRLQPTNLGTVSVRASQNGDGTFFAASNVTRSIKVVDTRKPRVGKTRIKPAGEGVTFTGSVEDNHIPVKLEIRFAGSSDVIKVKLKKGDKSNKRFSVQTDLPDGASSAQLVAIDKAGNRSRIKRIQLPDA